MQSCIVTFCGYPPSTLSILYYDHSPCCIVFRCVKKKKTHLFIHSIVDWHSGSFQFEAITNMDLIKNLGHGTYCI